MKLLVILALATLALGQETFEAQKITQTNDVPQAAAALQGQQAASPEEPGSDKKVDKRSYGWGPWGWGHGGHGGHVGHGVHGGHGWPWYGGWSHGGGGWHGGWADHGWYGGWYPGWPWWYGGWHGGHGSGWHGK